ncbi:MAG: hypothetical protein ACPG2Y_03255, partial [Acholeplasmataceae bacterium]
KAGMKAKRALRRKAMEMERINATQQSSETKKEKSTNKDTNNNSNSNKEKDQGKTSVNVMTNSTAQRILQRVGYDQSKQWTDVELPKDISEESYLQAIQHQLQKGKITRMSGRQKDKQQRQQKH